MDWRRMGVLTVAAVLAGPAAGAAQSLGTFRWQLEPYCNIVTVTVTQVGGTYRLEGTDDQCGGGAVPASAIGTAFLNPDGTVGLGLTIVAAPGGTPMPVSASLALATLSGTWRDANGLAGTFTFTDGAGTGGSPRPLPSPVVIPPVFNLRPDGGFVAGGALSSGGSIPASGAGVRMMWYPGKAAFRAGQAQAAEWNDVNVGSHSMATGLGTVASGDYSTALGSHTSASGRASTALGYETRASGEYSTALGVGTRASGSLSTALGTATTASGDYSLAAGYTASAGGQNSVALGNLVEANGEDSFVLGTRATATTTSPGAFVFGDRSTSTPLIVANGPNTFTARAAGGVVFYTNAAMTVGVQIAPSGTQWLVFSDVNSKHLFRDLDGEEVLGKLAGMPIREWSYKAQDAAIRHVGPTAQDFRAAFGLGEDPLRIGTLDADGIALAAIQALEARTRVLMEQNTHLADENHTLAERNDDLAIELRDLREQHQRASTDLREALARLEALIAATVRDKR